MNLKRILLSVLVIAIGYGGFSATPTITLTPSNSPSFNFGNVPVGNTSAYQSYTVAGTNLTSAITISVSGTGFLISTSAASGYGTTNIVLNPTGGTVTATTIYIELQPLSSGILSGSITHTSTGATTRTATLSGTSLGFSEVYLPQYMQGAATANTNRIPYAYCVTITGLTPNFYYNYYNSVVIASDPTTGAGAGNAIYANPTGSFTRSTGPALSAGNMGNFQANASGSYTGWFIAEPTGNASRFVPGGSVKMRIVVGAGASTAATAGTSAVYNFTSTNTVTVINLITGATGGSPILGTSCATGKNFVLLWDNASETGRPVSSAIVEDDGVAETTGNSYATFYSSNVDGVAGAWGTILPTSLANGIRLIKQYSLTGGTATGIAATSSNGTWPTGSVNTVNPAGGTTALIISSSDAPLSGSQLTASPTSLTGFSTSNGNASASQTFNLTGKCLTGAAITITAPANYEISLDGTTWSNTLSPSYTGSSLSATTIYVHIADTAAAGTPTGNIQIYGSGIAVGSATNVAVSGVVASGPTASVSISPTTTTEIGQTTVTITVTTSSAVNVNSAVTYTISGTGITSSDFVGSPSLTGTIAIPNGSTTGTATIQVYDDNVFEGTETATVTISNPTGNVSAVNVASGSFTITDDQRYYWNGANPTGTTANGGSGTWNTTVTNTDWLTGPTGTPVNFTNGFPVVVAGTAGTISLTNGATVSPTTTSISTSGYILTPAGSTTTIIKGSILLDPNVTLILNDSATTADKALSVTSISGGTGAGLVIAGRQTGGGASRVNIATSGGSITLPVTISGNGADSCFAGIVSTVGTASVTGNITNNGTQPTMLGATSGNKLFVSGNLTGTGGVAFSSGNSGGAGLITLSGTNTYSGKTYVNNAATGTVRCGSGSSLSPNSLLVMGESAGNGGNVDLNGFDQTIGGIKSNGGTGVILDSAATSGVTTLTINQATSTTYSLSINDGLTRKIKVVKAGAGTLTIAGANTFSAGLILNGGTIQMGATGNLLSNTLPFTFNGGAFSTGAAGGFDEAVGTLQLSDNSTIHLGSGSHTLKFNNSSALSWASGKTLTITGWSGTASSSGTATKFFVGTDTTGLTTAQLAQINFYGFNTGAKQLASGEVVPASANLNVDQTGFVSNFGNINFGTTSGYQSFVVSGTGLDTIVNVVPPAGYQISLASASGYQTGSITLNTAAGVLTATTIYVEFVPTTNGAQNGNIVVTSGIDTQYVAVTGNGVLSAVYSQGSGKAATDAIWSFAPVGTGQTIASLGGFSSTLDVVIQSGHTVTTSISQEITAKNLTINTGGALKELHVNVGTPYYINIYGDLTVNGQLGALNGADSLGLNVEGTSDLIQGSGSINLQRIRKSTHTNVTTNLTIAANVNLWWASTAVYNNYSGTSTFNVTINAGSTVNLQGNGDIAIDGTDGTGSGQRTGIITVNGTLTGVDTVYASTNNTSTGSIGFVIANGGLISAKRVMTSIGGTGNFSFDVQAGGKLDIYTALELHSGTFAPAGTVTFKSTSVSSVAYLDNFSSGFTGTYSGQLSAERYYNTSNTYNQHFMGSPVNAPALSQFGVSGNAGFVTPKPTCDETALASTSAYGSVFSFHEANGASCEEAQWKVETGGTAQNALGYSILKVGAGTLTLTGTANLASSYTVSGLTNGGWNNTSLQNRPYDGGWQLLANPYLATIVIDPSVNSSTFDAQVQVWNTATGSFQLSNTIAPFQAFMVHKSNAGGTASYTINASERTVSASTFYQLNANELTIVATNTTTGKTDQTVVGFNSNATDVFDPQFDANKLGGALNRHTLYTVNAGKWMAKNILNSIANTSTVDMGFEPGKSGNYILSFDNLNGFDPTVYIYLEDKALNIFHNVRNGNYSFAADSADNWNRFVLHFTPPAQVSTTEGTCTNGGSINIQQPGSAYWNYTLADSNNATVTTGLLNQNSTVSVTVAPGVYTLTLIDTNNYVAVKAVVVNGYQMANATFLISRDIIQVNQGITLTAVSNINTVYNWNLGDGSSALGNEIPVSYAQPGVYAVNLSVTNTDGCTAGNTRIVTVTAKDATGIGNVNGESELSIWSNSNNVYVDFSSSSGKAEISIYDILGQQLGSYKITATGLFTTPVNAIAEGYVIVMIKEDNKLTTKKLFITNN